MAAWKELQKIASEKYEFVIRNFHTFRKAARHMPIKCSSLGLKNEITRRGGIVHRIKMSWIEWRQTELPFSLDNKERCPLHTENIKCRLLDQPYKCGENPCMLEGEKKDGITN